LSIAARASRRRSLNDGRSGIDQRITSCALNSASCPKGVKMSIRYARLSRHSRARRAPCGCRSQAVLLGVFALPSPAANATAAVSGCSGWTRTSRRTSRPQLVGAMSLDQKIAELYGRGDFRYTARPRHPGGAVTVHPRARCSMARAAGVGTAICDCFPMGSHRRGWDVDIQRRVGAIGGRPGRASTCNLHRVFESPATR